MSHKPRYFQRKTVELKNSWKTKFKSTETWMHCWFLCCLLQMHRNKNPIKGRDMIQPWRLTLKKGQLPLGRHKKSKKSLRPLHHSTLARVFCGLVVVMALQLQWWKIAVGVTHAKRNSPNLVEKRQKFRCFFPTVTSLKHDLVTNSVKNDEFQVMKLLLSRKSQN